MALFTVPALALKELNEPETKSENWSKTMKSSVCAFRSFYILFKNFISHHIQLAFKLNSSHSNLQPLTAFDRSFALLISM